MVRFGGKFGIKYLAEYVIDFLRYLRDEFQLASHDEFICQRVKILELHIMFILNRNWHIF